MSDEKLTIGIGEKEEEQGPQHVDDFVAYGKAFLKPEENEEYARWMLMHFRLPAMLKMAFDDFIKDNKLFCEYKNKKYRVTGASRLGDIWLAKDFKQDMGYDKRVMIDSCSKWSKS